MALFVGIDVSKEKFDACGVGDEGKKVFSVSCPMNREGFDKLIVRLPEGASLLLGMESTASYHIALFSFLAAKGYRVAIINPLLIANFAKLSLRKTKTDKKDAFVIAQFLLLRKEVIAAQTEPPRLTELKDLSRRKERIADQITSLKNDMKRILSVTFPELETIAGVFTKSMLRLLVQYPSAHAMLEAGSDAVAAIVIGRSRGRKLAASVQTLMETAATSVGVVSPAKDLVLRQEAALLIHLEEQGEEIMKAITSLSGEKMKRDAEIMTSMKGIGEKTAFNFLIELGEDIRAFENDKKLIAAAGLDPTVYESGKYKGQSKISKRGNRHLRRVIWLMTTKAIISNQVFREYYFKRRKDGLIYKMAVLATAHKLIRVMFSMLVHERHFELERTKKI
ncbi:MAG: IS110 family transposase [Syntrophorhabdales bacterium]|jgi:transposase